jgi:transglutaminase-like putative cysteine protease
VRGLLLAALFIFGATDVHAWGRGAAPDWLKAAARESFVSEADSPAVIVHDETETTVSPSGEMRSLHRRAYRILTTEGRDLAHVAVYFDTETRLLSLRGWAITAKAEEYAVKERDAVETSPFDGELYSDSRVKILELPAAEPGNVIGYEYEQVERPYSLQVSWPFQAGIPVHRASFTLALPPDWTYETRWVNAEKQEPSVSGNRVTWQVAAVPAIKEEPGMPALRAVAGRLAASIVPANGAHAARVHRSWNDVAQWYSKLAAPRSASTAQIQAKVRQLTAEAANPLSKVSALARFAQSDVRYVAIEIGIGGYQPHAAQDVFANRYGDCKDKVTILRAMLREVGIDSHYVLVNTDRGVVDPAFATHTAFNHAIIAIRLPDSVPADNLYSVVKHPRLGRLMFFDPTNSNTPIGHLPEYLQENRGLLVTDDGGELIDLAAHPPAASRLTRTARLSLDPSGALSGQVHEVRSGAIAARYRDLLQTLNETERKQFIENALSFHLTHYVVRDLAFENLNEPSADLIVRYAVNVPNYAKQVPGMVLLRPRVIGRKAEPVLDLKERKFGYVTSGPTLEVDQVEITVPAGLLAEELPEPRTVSTPALAYTSHSNFKDGVLSYRREYKVNSFLVPREGLKALNDAYTRILADERGNAVLVRK